MSRSAAGRRHQLKSAAKAQAAAQTAASTVPALQHPVGHGQIYVQPHTQSLPDSVYQPHSHSIQPIALLPVPISSLADERWLHDDYLKDIHYQQVHSARDELASLRLSTPPSSPEVVTPRAMSFSSMSLRHIDPSSSPPAMSPLSTPYVISVPASVLFQQHPHRPVTPKTSEDSAPPAFVYPTCRSGAHPNRSPTSPSFAKLGRKKKKQSDEGLNDDGKSEKSQTPKGGRFRALLKRSKRKKMLPPVPEPLPSETIDITRDHSPTATTTRSIESFAWLKKHDQTLHPYLNEAPYMQAYDPPFLENDRQFTSLLRRLTPRESPSFHDYGRHPPAHVLDIGCGTGTWALEAATFWKSHRTQVTGYDLVDIAMEEWGRDIGSAQNLTFIRGNFLTNRLPFPDRNFDLVRMANLTLCIPYSKWEPLLAEVRRVMTINGRLELVDDQILFPYARPYSPANSSEYPRGPLGLDLSMTSSSANIPRWKDSDDASDGADSVLGQDDSDVEGSSSATPTVAGDSDTSSGRSSDRQSNGSFPGPRSKQSAFQRRPSAWDLRAATCQGLETVFENMLNERFHIHPRPSEFLLDVMKRVFGRRHSSLMRSMHLELAPTELHLRDEVPLPSREEFGAITAAAVAATSSRGRVQDVLSQCPGIVLWPSMHIPVPRAELEMHACKHIRTLLGCKAALADYVELRDSDTARVVDEEFWDAMFEYESFLHQRFEGLPRAGEGNMDPRQAHARTESVETFNSTSTSHESVLEYQSMFRNRFDMGTDRTEPSSEADSILRVSPKGVFQNYDGLRLERTSVVPPYTPQELTHIRTIRVYEALKLTDEPLS